MIAGSSHRVTRAAAVLSGAASGGRTFTGLAALALSGPVHATDEPDRTLARPPVRGMIALAALGELAADKLPQAPSRLQFPGSAARVVVAATCGVIVARRAAHAAAAPAPDPLAPPPRTPPEPASPQRLATDPAQSAAGPVAVAAATAAVAALAWAIAGVRWRRWAASRTGHDWVGAVAEDAAVIALAAAGARRIAG